MTAIDLLTGMSPPMLWRYCPVVCHRTPERMNVPDERPWSASASRQVDDAHSDSQHVNSARHAAEALFKPKAQAAPIRRPSPTSDAVASEQPPLRKPRILMSSKAEPEPRPAPETPAAAPAARQAAAAQPAVSIPASEYRRVRTLATYGMTPEQVAELYEASLSEVTRIIGNREARNKA